jgi:DNA-binding transcriptional ArsR family regulator
VGRVTEEGRTFDLVDERALRLMAHPLRMRLLGILRVKGPATASQLASRIDESSGVTSYHLRKLAEAGVVEEDTERGTRKERWWRAKHDITHWSNADFLGSPKAHQALLAMQREGYRFQWRVLEQWLAEETEWDTTWVDAVAAADCALEMSPEMLKAMGQEIWDVVQRYRSQPVPEGQDKRWVFWFQHGVPVRDLEVYL